MSSLVNHSLIVYRITMTDLNMVSSWELISPLSSSVSAKGRKPAMMAAETMRSVPWLLIFSTQ